MDELALSAALPKTGLSTDGQSYRVLFEQHPVPMWVYDRQTLAFLAVNEAMVRHYGYSREELVGRSVLNIRSPDEASRLVVFLKQMNRRPEITQPAPAGRWEHRRKDGSVIEVEITDTPITFQGRDAMLVFAQDVTERLRVEAALRDREARLHLAVSQMPALLWSTDSDLRITSSVGAALAALNLQPHETDGLSLYEYFQTNDDDFPHIAAHRAALAGRSMCYEGEWQGRVFQTSIEPLYAAGKIVGCIGLAFDITERKRAEAKLQDYAQRLRTLSRRLLMVQETERRRLACELHDEIGQLLLGLKLSLESSRRLPPEARDARLHEAQLRVQDLAAHIRELSLQLRPTMLDDLGLLPALLWLFERYTRQTGVQVNCEHDDLDHRLHPEVETAAYRIVQEALTNVARHAGVQQATVRLWLDHDVLGVQVEDRGQGFDPQTVLAAGRSTGLSGMQERVEFLGGQLTIEARPGGGTRVTAELPLAPAPEGASP